MHLEYKHSDTIMGNEYEHLTILSITTSDFNNTSALSDTNTVSVNVCVCVGGVL